MPQQIRFLRGASVAAFGTVLLAAAPAWAAGSNMPWEQPLNQILQSVEGPVAKIIAVIIIVVTGLTLAFGDLSGGFRRLIRSCSACRSHLPPRASSYRSSPSAAAWWFDG